MPKFPMQALFYDNLFRQHVTSETNPSKAGPYLVDLTEYNGVGSCSCWPFIKECKPTLQLVSDIGLRINVRLDTLRCKHIEFLRGTVAKQLLDDHIKKELESEKVRAGALAQGETCKATQAASVQEQVHGEEDGGLPS